MLRRSRFSLGHEVTIEELEGDPHAVLARLREREPVSWLPALDGWLITRHDLVTAAMRDASTFTVEDPRFSTAQVIGPSMLSLDGGGHETNRAPFTAPFRPGEVRARFAQVARGEARRLLGELGPGTGPGFELRRGFAGPLAAAVVGRALGLERDEVPAMLGAYAEIVNAVTEITAGRGSGERGRAAFARLADRLRAALARDPESLLGAAAREGTISLDEVLANAGILLFGGIETTEGMIAGAALQLLRRPSLWARLGQAGDRDLDALIDESLRLEPSAAVIDRYATADTELEGASIASGELVRLSIAAANRDPALFPEPDRFDPGRPNLRRHLAFAQGPHVCLGVHLARLETRIALQCLAGHFPKLRLDPAEPAEFRGLVFRKPTAVPVLSSLVAG